MLIYLNSLPQMPAWYLVSVYHWHT